MRRCIALALILCPMLVADARAVTMQWSPVGNPGNAADPTVMSDGTSGYGAVGYAYNIGTKDVTFAQYVEFLNAKDPTGANTLFLFDANMRVGPDAGISYSSGALSGHKYGVISGNGNHPVDYVSWYSAIRFANWLNNGQGTGDTETGAYTLGGSLYHGIPLFPPLTHNAGATIWVPTENEWYKAAYYDPRTTAQGGPPLDSHYWQYPTSNNSPPIGSGPTALANHVNIWSGGPLNNHTDVGAYSGTTSPYGAFDMGGNVWQWIEAPIVNGYAQGIRGGDSWSLSGNLLSSERANKSPILSEYNVGFRLAMVPEPSSIVLAAMALMGSLAWCRQRRANI